jgi:hypothetical protein
MMDSFAHIREALELSADARYGAGDQWNLWKPIRETPLSAYFDKTGGAMENMRPNPNLPAIWFHRYGIRVGDYAMTNPYIGGRKLREAVAIPNTLSILKIADEIIEGAEPWSDWKQYTRLIQMDTPKVNVPVTLYTQQVGGKSTDTIAIYKETTGKPPVIGGLMQPVALDCSGTNNSYRGTIQVQRNDVKDNNFLAVEQPLKNAGNLFYYLIGSQLISIINTNVTNTNTMANLQLATTSAKEFEAITNVIRNQFPGSQRNTADTMFIHPQDAWTLIVTAGSGGQGWPLVNRLILGPMEEKDVINDSFLASSLGLRNVWETPQQTQGTVTITKRDIASVTGLREDLTLENYDLTVGGLYNTDLVVRFDSEFAVGNGSFTITSYS